MSEQVTSSEQTSNISPFTPETLSKNGELIFSIPLYQRILPGEIRKLNSYFMIWNRPSRMEKIHIIWVCSHLSTMVKLVVMT